MYKSFLTLIANLGSASELGIPERTNDAEALTNILNLVYAIAAIVSVVCIIVYGIMYSVSAGVPERIVRAKNGVIYAAVGLVIVILAFTITNYILGSFKQ